MADVLANGVRFHVQRLSASQDGGAPLHGTVIFIHGLLADDLSSFYFTLANPVAKAGADVILYDLRGHGKSERSPDGYTVADSVDDLRALIDELGVDGPVRLVGNSYGGTVAVSFALRYPELVADMVLIEAHVPLDGWGDRMRDTFDDLQNSLRDPANWRLMESMEPRASRYMMRRARLAETIFGTTSLAPDLAATPALPPDALASVDCPVLAVYGEHSDVFDYGVALAEQLPRCVHHVVPDYDHSLLLNGTSDVRGLFLDWLTERAPAAPLPHQRSAAPDAAHGPTFTLTDA